MKKDDLKGACPALKKLADQLAAAFTLINELKADHNAHCAGTHTVADTTNVVTSANVDPL
jgi:hypothetical protein